MNKNFTKGNTSLNWTTIQVHNPDNMSTCWAPKPVWGARAIRVMAVTFVKQHWKLHCYSHMRYRYHLDLLCLRLASLLPAPQVVVHWGASWALADWSIVGAEIWQPLMILWSRQLPKGLPAQAGLGRSTSCAPVPVCKQCRRICGLSRETREPLATQLKKTIPFLNDRCCFSNLAYTCTPNLSWPHAPTWSAATNWATQISIAAKH